MGIQIDGSKIERITLGSTDITEVYVGSQKIWPEEILGPFEFVKTISSDVKDYNLTAELINAGWGAESPVEVDITVASGIYVGATRGAGPAFEVEDLPTGSSVKLTILGVIAGYGGDGESRPVGNPGGTAISVAYPIEIDVRSGLLAGGGGGGNSATPVYGPGGGAGYEPGKGAPSRNVSIYDGADGTRTTGGSGGGGVGDGGDLGQPGGTNNPYGYPGGLAGYAFVGGDFITWTGGWGANSANVLGRTQS